MSSCGSAEVHAMINYFLTCFVCALMVVSECVWGLGERAYFHFSRGPQTLYFKQE